MEKLDLKALGLRALNEKLQGQTNETNQRDWEIINPRGSHAIAVGVDAVSYTHLTLPTTPYV